MRYKTTFILILGLFMISCDHPVADPELLDPIYSDLLKESKSVDSQVAAATKELEGFESELALVVPQTGKIKYAQKRVRETKEKLDKLKQMSVYWKLRVDSRRAWDQEHSLKAFKEKKPWPPPDEYSEYKNQIALERAPKNWNLKERLELAKKGLKQPTNEPAQAHGEH